MKGNKIPMKTHIKKIYACFPGGKHKVLTMSYDDGKHEDRRLLEIFNKNGIKGTFNLNSGLEGDPVRIPQAEYKELYKGHEVACHTVTHPTISRCPLTSVAQEIIDDRKKLEQIMGYPVRGLAYPNGSYSKEICDMLPGLGIRYGRIVGNTDDFAIPEDFLRWKATCHHNHNLIENGKRFLELKKKQYLYMMYVWGHSYEFTNNDNWNLIEEFCEMMGGADDIWYATNIEIVDYMDVVKMAQFAADGSFVYNPCAKSLWLCIEDDTFIEVKGGEQVNL
jgi:peptidoglycan/xylan/chitin deacetylase (PgdA/CDA1 family)